MSTRMRAYEIQTSTGKMQNKLFFDKALLQLLETIEEQGIFTTDAEFKIQHWNLWLENLTGYPAGSIVGRSILEVYPDLSARNMDEYFSMALKGQVSVLSQRFHRYLIPITVRSADSQPAYMQQCIKIAPLSENNTIVGTITIIQDVTERVEREKALVQEVEINKAIAELSKMLLSPVTIDDISSIVMHFAKQLTSSSFGYIGYRDIRTGSLVSSSPTDDVWNICPAHDRNTVLNEFYSLWGWVLERRSSVIINKPSDDPRETKSTDHFIKTFRFLASPAKIGNELVGQIALANSGRDYNDQDLSIIERLAGLYAIAIQRTRMEEELRSLSLIDALTGLYNRRGFETLAKQQIKTAERMKKGLFLIFGDLDDLKKINDTYGHKAGDTALVETAKLLREAFRESDIIARIGGDEFVILGIESYRIKNNIFLQRLNKQFATFNEHEARSFLLSISLGIAEYDPDNPCSYEELLCRADAGMYDVKKRKTEHIA